MGILDQVTQMKQQGKADEEIIQELQQQGVNPKSIQDAISQAQVKDAVAGAPTQGMQQSIMNENQGQNMNPSTQEMPDEYIPSPQYPGAQPPMPQAPYTPQQYQEMPEQEMYGQEAFQPQEYYPQDYGDQGGYEYGVTASSTGTLIEIAEQVFSDKIKKIQRLLDDLNEFKVLTETRINTTEERLKRIETTIDKLQLSILDKIGSYGKDLSTIQKEMTMMQDSFGKIVNTATRKTTKKLK